LLYRRPSNSNLLIHEKEREHPNREGFHTLIRERSNPGLQKESVRPAGSNSGIYSQLRALMQSIESPGKVKIYFCICDYFLYKYGFLPVPLLKNSLLV
jgi:hypothetical protein